MSPSEALASVDWVRYQEEAFLAAEDAIRHYTGRWKASLGAPVCQFAIWTRPQARITGISIETEAHALTRGGAFSNSSTGSKAPALSLVSYREPGDFEFEDYHCVFHPCLLNLGWLDFDDEEQEAQAMALITARLVAVRDQVLVSGLVATLPRSSRFWIGVNSVDAWFDQVVEVQCDH